PRVLATAGEWKSAPCDWPRRIASNPPAPSRRRIATGHAGTDRWRREYNKPAPRRPKWDGGRAQGPPPRAERASADLFLTGTRAPASRCKAPRRHRPAKVAPAVPGEKRQGLNGGRDRETGCRAAAAL